MTSVSAGHTILTPTKPVGSGRPQRGSNPGPPHQESRAEERGRGIERKRVKEIERHEQSVNLPLLKWHTAALFTPIIAPRLGLRNEMMKFLAS